MCSAPPAKRLGATAPASASMPSRPSESTAALGSGVSPDGLDRCIIDVGSDTPHQLALYIGLLDTDFDILDAPDLARAFVRLAERYHRAAQASMR